MLQEASVICHLTAEMLLGQISNRQRSDIYNYVHGYDTTKKQSVKAMPREFYAKDTNPNR